jgi:hypothetical protein
MATYHTFVDAVILFHEAVNFENALYHLVPLLNSGRDDVILTFLCAKHFIPCLITFSHDSALRGLFTDLSLVAKKLEKRKNQQTRKQVM